MLYICKYAIMKKVEETLKLNIKQKRGKGIFRMIEFEDHGHTVVYIPSLNLSAYGNNLEEAHEMMANAVLEDFFEALLEQPEHIVFEVLGKLGWQKSPIFSKELSNNVHIDRNGLLKNFNLPQETKITEKLVEV